MERYMELLQSNVRINKLIRCVCMYVCVKARQRGNREWVIVLVSDLIILGWHQIEALLTHTIPSGGRYDL